MNATDERAATLRREMRSLEYALLQAIDAAETEDIDELRRVLSAITLTLLRVFERPEAA